MVIQRGKFTADKKAATTARLGDKRHDQSWLIAKVRYLVSSPSAKLVRRTLTFCRWESSNRSLGAVSVGDAPGLGRERQQLHPFSAGGCQSAPASDAGNRATGTQTKLSGHEGDIMRGRRHEQGRIITD